MSGLLLTQDFPPALPGGISVYYYHLCRAIGGAVSVLAPRAADAAEFDASQPFAIHRCRMPTVPLAHRREIHLQALRWPRVAYVAACQWLAFYRRGLALVRGEPGQIALLGHLYLAPLGPWLRRRAGIRYGVFLHSGELYRYMGIRPVRSAMIAALDDADFLIVNSDFTRRQYLERGVRSDQRFLKVNPGVDTSLFRPDAGDPLGVRRRFGLGDRPIVLSVARLVEQKGHDNVLRAFPQILTRVPEAIYVIAGDGPFRPDLERLARELGLEGRVVFAGFVPEAELPSYYRAADVVVVPSREFRKGVPIEGFGMVYVEAGACGIPAVGGRGGGTEESIEEGVTGFRVDAEEPTAIGDAVARLLSDRELASRLGAAGRRRALERFDWTIQAEVLRGFLDELPGAAAASRERVGKL